MNASLRFSVLLLLFTAFAQAQERCGVAKDFVVRALERVTPKMSRQELEDGLQLLKHASEQCAGLGDAWYYRSLFETRIEEMMRSGTAGKLGRLSLADYALRKAKLVGSEALDQKLDPFTLATSPEQAQGLSRGVRDKWALVIGIGKFRDRRIPRLKYTTKDAQDFAAALKDRNYGKFRDDHVRLLADEQATTVRIKSELNWLARSAAPEDLIVLYLTSHGSPRELDTVGVNYVITHDTDVADQDSLFATALPMVDLANIIRTRVKALRAAIFLDTCHSGGAVTPGGIAVSSASGETLNQIRQGVGRVIITSSQVSEKSWESDAFRNGYFTYYLIQALKQNNGLKSIASVYDYLREQVSRQVLADVKVRQTPVMSRSEQGADIVIGVPASSTVGQILTLPLVARRPALFFPVSARPPTA